MYDFLTILTNITGLGKRKSPENDQEVSPAKRSRAAARELAGMPNAGQRLKTSSHELPATGRQSADVAFTSVPQQSAEPKAQQQLHLGRPAHHANANLHQNQHSQQQQQQQQQMTSTRQLQELDSSAYDRVKQKLERPPVGSTALRHRAAQARPADSKHMPVPSQLMAVHKQDHAVHRGTPAHRPAFFRTAQRSSSPQQTWRLSPAEVGAAFRSSVRKQDGYGAYGLAPPPPPQQQQHQQQQQRLVQRPYQPPAPALPAAAQRFHRDWGRRAGYGSAAAAGGQHAAAAAAAAVAAGAAGRAATGVLGASPPLQDVRQRLSYGGAGEVDAALLPVTAYGLAERGATAGPPHGRAAATAAAGTEAAGAAAPDRAAGGAAAGAGAGASTPPASFAAVYQETLMGFSGVDPGLAAAEAKIVAKLARAQADLKKAQQSKKEAAGRAQRLDHDISRAMYQRAADYQPNRSVPAVQLLEAEASAREQQRLQHQAELHQQRQLNQLRHQELLAAAVKVPPPESMVSHRHEQQQQQEQEQQQQEDDEDVVVIDVSSEEAGDHSDQQQYQNGTDDFTYPDEQAQGSASAGGEVSSEVDEAEGDEASQEQESEEQESEEEEVDQAAEGIHALGISAWMGPRADWSVTQQQMTRFNQATAGPGSDHDVLASHERASLELMRADLATMRPGEWLNDECMNMYMALLQDRDAADRANGGLCCHFFNTFFLNKLYMDANEYSYKNVRRWTMAARLKTAGQTSDCVLKCDRVIIPVHQGLHWTALMVDIKQQRLVFFDSLFGKNAAAVAAVRRWVADEAQDKLKVTWDTSGWKEVYPTDIPQQQNGFDCGVFALMFCNRMGLKGGAFDFRQQDISVNVRVAITCDLLDGAIKATARKT